MLKEKIHEPKIFQLHLRNMLNLSRPLCRLADSISWEDLHEMFKSLYSEDLGRPAKSVRLMVGFHYLKYMKDVSDEQLVEQWIENSYWQYFCGEEYFQTGFPIHPTSMTKWRNRLKDIQLQKLLETTIKSGMKTSTFKKISMKKVNVDTTLHFQKQLDNFHDFSNEWIWIYSHGSAWWSLTDKKYKYIWKPENQFLSPNKEIKSYIDVLWNFKKENE